MIVRRCTCGTRLAALVVFHVGCAASRAIVPAIRTVSHAILGCDHPTVRKDDLPPKPGRNTRWRISSAAHFLFFETTGACSVGKCTSGILSQRKSLSGATGRPRSRNPIGHSSRDLGRRFVCAFESDQWDGSHPGFLGRIEGWYGLDLPRTSSLVGRSDTNVGFGLLSPSFGWGSLASLVPTTFQLHRVRYGSRASIEPYGDGSERRGTKAVDGRGRLRIDVRMRQRSIREGNGEDIGCGGRSEHATDEQMDEK